MTVNIVFDSWKKQYYRIWYDGATKRISPYEFKFFFWTDYDEEKFTPTFRIEKDSVVDMFGKKLNRVTILDNSWKTLQAVVERLRNAGHKTYLSDVSFENKCFVESGLQLDKRRTITYLDIETDLCNTPENPKKPITSITVYVNTVGKYVCYVWREDQQKRVVETDTIVKRYYSNEIEMLRDFLTDCKTTQADIMAGWYSNDFDMPYIIKRCELLGLDYKVLSPFNDVYMKVKEVGEEFEFYMRAKGVHFVDLIPVLKKAVHKQPPSYKLDVTAKYYLDTAYGKYEGANAGSWREDLEGFINYNIRDVELLVLLDEKIGMTDYLVRVQTETVPMCFDELLFNSVVLDNFLRYRNKDLAYLDNSGKIHINDREFDQNCKVEFEGARVIPPKPGKYKNIVSMDFSGMYTTIYKTFNMSPDTLDENGDIDLGEEEVAVFQDEERRIQLYRTNIRLRFKSEPEGLVPRVVGNIIDMRKKYKDERDKHTPGTLEYKRWHGLQDAIKEVGNSMYGVMGFTRFRFFDIRIAAAITKIGRMMSQFVEDYVNSKGYSVIYGDTDSIFIDFHEEELSEVKKKAKELEVELNLQLKLFTGSICNNRVKNHCLKIGIENYFTSFFLPPVKKKYAGIKENGELYIKGLELVRRDTPESCKGILRDVFIKALQTDDIYELRAYTQERLKSIHGFAYHAYGSPKHISSDLGDYSTGVQHIRAAQYSNTHLGTQFGKADRPYLIFVRIKAKHKFPDTDVVCIDFGQALPEGIEVDMQTIIEKFIVNKIKILDAIPGFDHRILFDMERDNKLNRWF
jgi:DNA polymerase elongation subunit (family B)